MRKLKSKRWYRRNRHTNPDLVKAYKDCQWCFEYYGEPYVVVLNSQLSPMIDNYFYPTRLRAISISDLKWARKKQKEAIATLRDRDCCQGDISLHDLQHPLESHH